MKTKSGKKRSLSLTTAIALTTICAAKAGIIRLSEPDAYIQDGLVAAYDGIHNDGLDKPHNFSAPVWKCLVQGGPDLEFKTGGEELAGEEGFWVGDGYVFRRATLAEMKQNVALGANFTIQLACELDLRPVSDYGDQYEGWNFDNNSEGQGYPTLIGETDDHGLYMDRKHQYHNSSIIWKGDDIIHSGKTRPVIHNYYPRTLTMIADESEYGILQGPERSAMTARSASGSYANTKFSLGGRINNDKHYSKGLFHGARFYSRALSNEELLRNYRVDMVRYYHAYPAQTVTIAPSIHGATGTEGVGTWEVAGSYTFTAPETVTLPNGNVYRCTGYELCVSEDEMSLAEATVFSGSREYVYDNSSGTAHGVRLVWTWELVSGLEALDAAACVQDGLLLHLDGIENSGEHLHKGNVQVWHDLANGNHAINYRTDIAGKDGNWTDNGYAFHFGNYFSTRARVSTTLQSTLQVVCNAPVKKMLKNTASTDSLPPVTWPNIVGTVGNDFYNLFLYAQQPHTFFSKMLFKTGYNSAYCYFEGNGEYYSCFHDSRRGGPARIGLTQDGTYPSTWSNTNDQTDENPIELWSFGSAPCVLSIGGTSRLNEPSENHRRNIRGVIHAVRYYARLLTPSELEWNRRLDDIRFRGGNGAALVVASERRDACGNEQNGPYDFAGKRTFSAPAEVEASGRTYACAGYRLELWDETNGYWKNYKSGNETSVELDSLEGRQRLTWRWKIVRAMRTAADYDVDDYVQNGLVAAYDGIRNVGYASEHAAYSDSWADWSGNGKGATIHQLDLTTDWIAHNEGAWLDDAYRFNGEEVMLMERDIGLGRTPTIQCVVDYVPGEQKAQYPTFIAAKNDAGLFTANYEWDKYKTLQWKLEPLFPDSSGDRPKTAISGRYYTLQALDSQAAVFTTVARSGTANISHTSDAIVQPWTIGSGHLDNDYAKTRAMIGGFQSLRYYNRLLDDAELLHNRMVDVARFEGVLMTTNLVIAINKEQIASDSVYPLPGVYTVEGDCELTARDTQVIVDGEIVKYRASGYERQHLNSEGEWTTIERSKEQSLVYTPDETPTRILWKYVIDKRFAIMIR